MIGRTVSHYRIVGRLGEGGMGVVYKAEDLRLKRPVALKFLPPHLEADESARKRFVHEAQAASALEHPNICSVYEIDTTPEGQTFIAMPCYEGQTLRERLSEGPLPLDEALDIASQVAGGLSRAHEKGISHRDIKPGNVFVTGDGTVKVMDFGLAKLAGATRMTRTGVTVGTVAYMSPEQAKGEESDHRTDVWSLGVVLYEMLTGKLPFRGDVDQAQVYSILNEDPARVKSLRGEVPIEIENIVERALEKSPEKRFQSIDEMLADLKREGDRLALGLKGRRLPKVRASTRRRVLRVAIPLVAAAAFVAVLLTKLDIQISTKTPQAYAEENSIAIMYFENVEDPGDEDMTAQMVTNLVTRKLGDSDYLRVVSQQRIYDVLKQLGEEDAKVIDKQLASEVAQRLAVKWLVTGNVIQTKPNIVVTTEVADQSSGKIRTSAHESGNDVFTVADKLTLEISKDLALPDEAMDQFDRSVTEVTTSSKEAYMHYLEGARYFNKLYWEDAGEKYLEALEYDSTFAMAYLKAAQMKWAMCAQYGKCDKPEVERLMAKAKQYSAKLTELERMYYDAEEPLILNFDIPLAKKNYLKIVEKYPDEKQAWLEAGDIARLWLGGQEEAIRYYQRALDLDPTFGFAYGWLAYSYSLVDTANSMWAANKYISLSPNEAFPYQIRADLYAFRGMALEAIADYAKAQSIKPGFLSSLALEKMYMLTGQYDRADSLYRQKIFEGEPQVRREARDGLAYVQMRQGKLNDAIELLDAGLAAERLEGQRYWGGHALKAMVYIETMDSNDVDRARREHDTVTEIIGHTHTEFWCSYLCFLALVGRTTEIEKYLPVIETKVKELLPREAWRYWMPRGYLELATGDPDFAIAYLERSVDQLWEYGHERTWFARYFLALALLKLDRLEEAVVELEELRFRELYAYEWYAIWMVKVRYLLGVAYEGLGRTGEAVAMYEEFLDIWKGADPDLEAVVDARARLARLRGS